MAAIPGAGALTQQGPAPLPPPVAGKTVNAAVRAGKVRFRVPGQTAFVALTAPQQVPGRTDLRHHGGPRDADLRRRYQRRHPSTRGSTRAPSPSARRAGPRRSRRSRWPAPCGTTARGRGRPRPRVSNATCGATAGAGSAPAGASAQRPSAARVGGHRIVATARSRASSAARSPCATACGARPSSSGPASSTWRAREESDRVTGSTLRRLPGRPHGGRLPVSDRLAGATQARRPTASRSPSARWCRTSPPTRSRSSPALIWIGSETDAGRVAVAAC